ncbi:unnamed protein product, partial [Tilletia controversa]
LNFALDHFAVMWNNHAIRTPGLNNRSPLQLRAEGIIDARQRGVVIMDGPLDDAHLGEQVENVNQGLRNFALYGVDFVGQGRERRDDDPHVHIEAIDHLLPPALLDHELQAYWRSQLPPAWPPSQDFGVTAYTNLLDMIFEHLSLQ